MFINLGDRFRTTQAVEYQSILYYFQSIVDLLYKLWTAAFCLFFKIFWLYIIAYVDSYEPSGSLYVFNSAICVRFLWKSEVTRPKSTLRHCDENYFAKQNLI